MSATPRMLNRLVADFCPNGGIGMIYATDPMCAGCPLVKECVEVHHERVRQACLTALAAKMEKGNQ